MKSEARPRSYSFSPVSGYASEHVAWFVAALEEVTERHFDVLRKTPESMLDTRLGEAPSSIMQITAHMGWADSYWLGCLRGQPIPAPDVLNRDRHEPPSPYKLKDVLVACREVRETGCEFLRGVAEPHRALPWRGEGKLTVHGVLMHLIWHWTYHNGQCGEIELSQGHVYPWGFEQHVGRVEDPQGW
jgi:uncharacterized damage-inducible protein DinB